MIRARSFRSTRLRSARLARLGPARPGSDRPGSPGSPGSARLGPTGSTRLARLGPGPRQVCPCLDLYQGAQWQLGHRDGAASRAVSSERLHVGLVHRRIVTHVDEEHRRLGDVHQSGTLASQERLEVGDGLAHLGVEARHQLPISQTQLA
jgi:hypothetical protein